MDEPVASENICPGYDADSGRAPALHRVDVTLRLRRGRRVSFILVTVSSLLLPSCYISSAVLNCHRIILLIRNYELLIRNYELLIRIYELLIRTN